MYFEFNASDPIILELLKYADGNKKLLEEAMHYAYSDQQDKNAPVSVDLIIKHITLLKEFSKKRVAVR